VIVTVLVSVATQSAMKPASSEFWRSDTATSLVPRLCITGIEVSDPFPMLAEYLRATTEVSIAIPDEITMPAPATALIAELETLMPLLPAVGGVPPPSCDQVVAVVPMVIVPSVVTMNTLSSLAVAFLHRDSRAAAQFGAGVGVQSAGRRT
jgi:hypothetical protein